MQFTKSSLNALRATTPLSTKEKKLTLAIIPTLETCLTSIDVMPRGSSWKREILFFKVLLCKHIFSSKATL